jgi:adenosylcobinamide-GDP ribazoletransferase
VTASVRAAVAAVAFLTRVPLGRRVVVGGADVARGAVLFPVVGAGVGVLGGLAAAGLEGPLPGVVAGALGVSVAIVLTGGLHVDALADAADALGAERERALEIMRDPRIGAFGAAAVAVALLVEAASLGALAEQGDAVRGFLVAGALSRATAPLLSQVLPYARPSGTGGVLSLGLAVPAPATGAALAVGAAALSFGWTGLVVAAAVAGLAVACGLAARAWLGGVTGDTLGATIQLAEVAALVVLLGLR